MSTRSSLKDLSGPRVRVRDVPRVASGSRGKFLLQSEPGKIKGPEAALALAKRHLSMRDAHTVVTRLFDHGEAVVELPAVESIAAFTHDLAACNVVARACGPPPKVDVKAATRSRMPIMDDVINALERVVADRRHPLFQTYLEFHERFGFRGLTNSWANRKVLDPAAAWFVANGLLDLTFLIHRKDTGYPSVIDGKDSRQPTEKQKDRAREEAQKIIEKYRPGTANPY